MKTFLSALVLISSMSVSAEAIRVSLPKAGTFLVRITSPSSCMSGNYSLFAKDVDYNSQGVQIMNVEARVIDVLYGRAQWCDQRDNTATGVFVTIGATELNVELVPGLEAPTVTVNEVVQTSPVE